MIAVPRNAEVFEYARSQPFLKHAQLYDREANKPDCVYKFTGITSSYILIASQSIIMCVVEEWN